MPVKLEGLRMLLSFSDYSSSLELTRPTGNYTHLQPINIDSRPGGNTGNSCETHGRQFGHVYDMTR